MEAIQYCGGIVAVLRGDSISTVEAIQYCGGIASVHVGDSISTVGDSISTAELSFLFSYIWLISRIKTVQLFTISKRK